MTKRDGSDTPDLVQHLLLEAGRLMEDAAPDLALARPDDPLAQEARIERVVQLSGNLRSLAQAALVLHREASGPN